MRDILQTYLLLLATTFFWGVQPLCVKWIMAEWSPITITVVRYIFIGLILLIIAKYRGEKIMHSKELTIPLMLMGLTGISIDNVAQFTGLTFSTITNCTLIAATSPAITASLAAIFIRERLSLKAWIGIIISVCGTLIIVSRGSWTILASLDFNYGDILFFISQVAWTVYSLIAVRVMGKISAVLTTAWAGIYGSLFTIIYGLLVNDLQVTPLDFPLMMALTFTIIFGGVMAMLFWNIGVKNAGPSLTSVFENVIPVVGMIGGALFFNEIIGSPEIIGAIAIFSGVYLTTHST